VDGHHVVPELFLGAMFGITSAECEGNQQKKEGSLSHNWLICGKATQRMAKPKNRPKILVAALDWGLGHATRCIPVVRELQAQGASVWLGGSGPALALLRSEFPDLPFLDLPAYDIRYHKSSLVWSIGSQLFKIINAVAKEHFVLRKFVRRQGIDLVISDCRFGCFTRRATCVFITHQLHIRAPNVWLSAVVNAFNRWFIRRYDQLWIPDFAEGEAESAPLSAGNVYESSEASQTGRPVFKTLAGALSHPVLAGGRYIGLLSRMKRIDVPERYDVVAVLSGPEPQRSMLEEKIIEQATGLEIRMLVVRGKLTGRPDAVSAASLSLSDYLGAEALNAAMCAAKIILARSGYSTLMDLARIGKPAILIPTPGQTEQEYLAEYWSEKGAFSVWTQEAFDLKKALTEAANLKGLDPGLFPEGGLSEAVRELFG